MVVDPQHYILFRQQVHDMVLAGGRGIISAGKAENGFSS
jgi:hypothetical protein